MVPVRLSLLAAAALTASSVAQAQVITVPLDVLTELDARVTVNTGRIDTLDGQIAANADATVALDARQQATAGAVADVDAKIAVTDAKIVGLDARVLAATDATVTLDGRVSAIETQVGGLAAGAASAGTRIDAIAQQAGATAAAVSNLAPQVAQTVRDVAALVPQVAQNARDIADVDIRATAGIDAVAARVTLNDQRDDAQDATLNDHDRRIRVAQSTADTARTETATLRADVDAGRAGLVRQAGPTEPVTVAAASGGTSVAFNGTDGDRRLTGVAAGIAANDAATVGQVNASATETLAAANGYTDRSIANALAATDTRVERMIAGNNRMLRAEIDSSAAGSAALASLPQSILPGSGMLGASVGGKGDQVAMALGLSKAFNAPHVPVIRAGAAIDTRTGDAVYNAAVGIHF